ncbi:MAG: hypothetical protein R6U56_05670 [Opitutales bacterium]
MPRQLESGARFRYNQIPVAERGTRFEPRFRYKQARDTIYLMLHEDSPLGCPEHGWTQAGGLRYPVKSVV